MWHIADDVLVVSSTLCGQCACERMLLIVDHMTGHTRVPSRDDLAPELTGIQEPIAKRRRRPLGRNEDATTGRREDLPKRVENDLPGIAAGPRRLEHAFVVFALVIVPYPLAAKRAAQADHVPSVVAGSADALHLVVPIEPLLPFAGENLPLRGVVAPDLFHNVREQQPLRSVSPILPILGFYAAFFQLVKRRP